MSNLILNSQVNISTRDFDGLRQAFFDYAQANFSDIWTDFNENSFAAAIAEIIAYLGDNLHFYLDRQTQDNFLSTTKDRQAAIDLAALIDYFPANPSPATGEITLFLDTGTFAYATSIAKGFQVSNGNGIFFETNQDVTVSAGSTSWVFEVTEGETIRETDGQLGVLAVADGSPFQSYILSRRNVILSRTVAEINANDELVVTVGGVQYAATNTLSTAQSTDKVFTIRTTDAGETTIAFGNGEFGVLPPDGSNVEAIYRVLADETNRAEQSYGNLNSNTVSVLVSSRTGVTSVNNLSQMSGGAAKETLDEIKINAPASLSALNRAVSLSDFAILAKTVTGVNKAVARAGEEDLDVVIHVAPDGGGLPSITLKNQVVTFFDDKKMAKTTVFAKDPVYQNVSISMKLFVEDTFKQSEVLENVRIAIEDLFQFDNMDFGRPVLLKSTGFDFDAYDFYEALENVSGISKVTLEKFTLKPTIYGIRDANAGTAHMSSRGTITRSSSKTYEFKIIMDTVNNFILERGIIGISSTLNDTTISDSKLDLSYEHGTSTDSGVSFLQDSSKSFVTNAYTGKTLIDSNGASFLIASNTYDTLTLASGTPASGSYTIVERLLGYYLVPNVLRSPQFKIISNTANSVTVSGGLGSVSSAGNQYRIYTREQNSFGTNPLTGTAPATTGTITAYSYSSGTLNSVTAAALAGVYLDDAFNGYQFILTSGDGINEIATVIDYTGASGVFTLGSPHSITTEPIISDTFICSPKYIMGRDTTVDGAFAPTTTQFQSTDLVGMGTNYYQGAIVKFMSGVNEGLVRRVNSSISANGRLTTDAFPTAPSGGDEFEIGFNYQDDHQTIVFSGIRDASILAEDEFYFRTSELIGDLIPSEIQILQVDIDNDVIITGIGGTE